MVLPADIIWRLDQIDAEYFVLLNSDIEVTEGLARAAYQLSWKTIPDVASCQPKILSINQKGSF